MWDQNETVYERDQKEKLLPAERFDILLYLTDCAFIFLSLAAQSRNLEELGKETQRYKVHERPCSSTDTSVGK